MTISDIQLQLFDIFGYSLLRMRDLTKRRSERKWIIKPRKDKPCRVKEKAFLVLRLSKEREKSSNPEKEILEQFQEKFHE